MVLKIGAGTLPKIETLSEDYVKIPYRMIEEDNLIDFLYSGDLNQMDGKHLAKRVILAPTNKKTLEMNEKFIKKKKPGEALVFCSSDSIVSGDPNDVMNYQHEFIVQTNPIRNASSYVLLLIEGVIVILLRNLNPRKGLCNGTRLIITGFKENTFAAKIISQCNRGDTVLLPRSDLAPFDVPLSFILKRHQFPVIPAYAMTINKSQEQTGFNKMVFTWMNLFLRMDNFKLHYPDDRIPIK